MLDIHATPPARADEVWCVFDGPRLLLQAGALPHAEARRWTLTGQHYLGSTDHANVWMAELVGPTPPNTEPLPLRAALMTLGAAWVGPVARAAQLRRFRQSHRYCGACAAPLQAHAHDQGMGCPACGEVYYPRLSPAMMVAVTRGRDILLARAPHFAPSVYSALAGFVEPGETLEHCVHRETREEVGLDIHRLRYVGSQSWPFPHSLMLAFRAEYLDGDIVPQPGEIEHAAWFDVDALPLIPQSLSIARWLIELTVEEIRRERG